MECTEEYLFYWYAKFCSNILISDDTGNAQSLKSACISSNSGNGKIKWIQLKSYCRYPYNSFFKVKYIMCISKPSFCLSIFGLYHYLMILKNKFYPQKNIFYEKCRILTTLPSIEKRGNGFEEHIYPNHI